VNITLDQAIHELKMGRPIKIGAKTSAYAYLHPEFTALATIKKLKTSKINNANKKTPEQKAALKLAVAGELIPELLEFKTAKKLPTISPAKIKAAPTKLILAAQAPLNLRDAGPAKIYAYRAEGKISEHLAIVIGKPDANPLVRVHSCCYTGDLLGSLSCDCQDQLRGAIKLMAKSGGILVYLMQEGRGIGLINKLRAYSLQASGLDTVEANEFLGFEDEERAFAPAAEILKQLRIKKIRLITNNPKKAEQLETEGIEVTKCVPIIIKHKHNQHYLETKAAKSGHKI